MATITESHVEEATLAWLTSLGFAVAHGPDLAPEGRTPERTSYGEVMGDEKLRIIAHELLTNLKQNVSVDWSQREAARARMRVLVKRILAKYGYPPAIRTVLQQAEVLSAKWAA